MRLHSLRLAGTRQHQRSPPLKRLRRLEAKADASEAQPAVADDDAGPATAVNTRGNRKGPLPFWVEVSLYASMPLFHVHTFIALTIVLACCAVVRAGSVAQNFQ